MNEIDFNKCQSIKSKKDMYLQCPNCKKGTENFCGIHLRNSKRLLYSDMYKEYNQQKKICIDNNLNNNYVCSEEDEINNLLENISNNNNMKINYIRNVIKKTYLKKFINTKQSRILLTNDLKKYIDRQRYFENNIFHIINIQKYIRRWIIYRRSQCSNDEDILYIINKYAIESKYFYRFRDEMSKKYYAYDIRALYELITSNYPSCPYTLRLFNDKEKKNINNHINKLKKYNIDLEEDKEIVKLTEEEEIELDIKELFYKINMLDNYTDHMWFSNLRLNELINLYIKSEDIWNYRSLLSETSKKNIIGNNKIFQIPIIKIQQEKSKKKIQKILIKYFNIMVSNGIDINEKKLGAILVLSGLVEVSHEASLGLPHLLQM